MHKIAFVFYPIDYVGFNKTQLIERRLLSLAFIGSKYHHSIAYTAGSAYRQFVPKVNSVHQYHYGIIRIYIQATGQWTPANGRSFLIDRSNIIIIEGDSFIATERQCSKLCDLLYEITGDKYEIDKVPDVACLGISEPYAAYYSINSFECISPDML
ncbi:MAG TPA: hypothetical protein VL995_19985 [Cellvibrio sp.]|nr:hypothetical protein [Cellvibrio sp.]